MNNGDMPANSTSLEISERYEAGHYDQVALGITKREHFASIAPYDEIDAIIGDSAESAAAFLDITVEEYAKDYTMNYIRCCMLCRRMWADALLKELDQ